LAVFGLVPGAEVEVLQRRPTCVVRIGETDLALDADIANEILVEPVGDVESVTS
jgi:Fe2+ transport system protein FeoA